MKYVLFICFSFFNTTDLSAQAIVNLVLVGDKGITENSKEAHSFIIVKKYPDKFERLDYKIGAPLKKLRSYSDAELKVLEGSYYEYAEDGSIAQSGYYKNNLKEKSWYYYNDTGKVILEEIYEQGVLIKTTNPDTVKKEEIKDENIKGDEVEAQFGKGHKDWIKYLTKNLNADVGSKSANGGTVRVGFVVDKTGNIKDVYLRKSVEFVLDNEALRIIENAPQWNPAFQDGRNVNAYRIQPITFSKE